MTAKDYLNQAFRIDQRINSKLDQVASLRDLSTRTGITLSDMPGNPNKGGSRVEDIVVKIKYMEDEIKADINKLVTLKQEIMGAIKSVDDVKCQMVLDLRYLCFMSWEDISVEMDCSVRNIHILHSKALRKVVVPK